MNRIWRHLRSGPWTLRRYFPPSALARIEAAVKACEQRHAGEIRFAVEAALPLAEAWRGVTPRQRAQAVFSQLRVWDTAHNNGVLIYVLLAERAIEIVADRGVGDGRVPQALWDEACRRIETRFRAGAFADGAVEGIEAVAAVLAQHPPSRPDAGNELPDAPVVL